MNKDKVLEIELSRERLHNNGYYYSSLELPAEEYEIRDAFQKARIDGETIAYLALEITYSPYVNDLHDMRLDLPTMDELNFLAKRLIAMDVTERSIYAAVLPQVIGDDDIVSMSTLINCTYGLDQVMIASNVSNDAQLGKFVIENELHDDINAIPEQSMYLLDKKKVGELYRTTYGCVYINNMTVFAGDYSMPEIYDGKQLPENENSEWFAFRLQVAEAPDKDVNETAESAEWISLPIERAAADRVAQNHNVSCIENCVYIGFESSIPQIIDEHFGDMADFDKLNHLSKMMLEMSPKEQIKFKAALEGVCPSDLDGIIDIAMHLEEFEINTDVIDECEFYKHYILHHLGKDFDPLWIENAILGTSGMTIIDRLGATVTDYGIVSARGHSLYEKLPYHPPQAKELTEQSLTDEKLEVVEVLGQTALFTNGRVTQSELPDGMYKYDLRQGENIAFATIEPVVKYDYGGTILLKAPMNFGDAEYFVFDEETALNFLGYE